MHDLRHRKETRKVDQDSSGEPDRCSAYYQSVVSSLIREIRQAAISKDPPTTPRAEHRTENTIEYNKHCRLAIT